MSFDNVSDLPKFKCHKIVQAGKIGEIQTQIEPPQLMLHYKTPEKQIITFVKVSEEWMEKHKPEEGGYFVLYKDGYESYSPAEAFESGYSLLDGK